jgi:hypothetical protein
MVVRVFVAGGTGVLGRRLVSQLFGPGPPGDGDDERGQAGFAGAAGRRGRRDGRAGCGVRGRGGGRGRAGRDRASDDGSLRGARRQTAERLGRAARARAEAAVPPGRGGTGSASWVHVDDAASAAVLAVEQNAKGCSASSTTSRPPSASGFRSSRSAPRQAAATNSRVAGPAAGRRDGGGLVTEGRGFSNAKAKRELGWELRYPSWRQGFQESWPDPGRGVRAAAAAAVVQSGHFDVQSMSYLLCRGESLASLRSNSSWTQPILLVFTIYRCSTGPRSRLD